MEERVSLYYMYSAAAAAAAVFPASSTKPTKGGRLVTAVYSGPFVRKQTVSEPTVIGHPLHA